MNPFPAALLADLADRYGTPLWVYDAETIRQRVARLQSFDTVRFAQKACSNTHVLRFLRQLGVKVDAVSLGELKRAQAAGYQLNCAGQTAPEVVLTADLLDRATLKFVVDHQVSTNAGSIDMLDQLGQAAPGHPVWLRINPGFGHGHSSKTNTGGETSKHGIWFEELSRALDVVRRHKLHLQGLHMHIGSGVDYAHLSQVCEAMVACVKQIHALGHDLQAISAGGGLSTPYSAFDPQVDTAHYFKLWNDTRGPLQALLGHSLHLEIEPGRFLVAESGVLLAEVRATKPMGTNHFVLVDAGFNDLMRPSMYGAYHEISLIARQQPHQYIQGQDQLTVVAGPLCESGDVFTQGEGAQVVPRRLSPCAVGDWLVFHDTGAYGASMSSNYNSRPLIAEVLVDQGQAMLIRRRQTMEELLALEEFSAV
jgi:diaminopimelate decarboxylase